MEEVSTHAPRLDFEEPSFDPTAAAEPVLRLAAEATTLAPSDQLNAGQPVGDRSAPGPTRQWVSARTRSQQAFKAIDIRALRHWPWMLRRLGISGQLWPAPFFEGRMPTQGNTGQNNMLMNVCTGEWELTDGEMMPPRQGFIALAKYVLGCPPIVAAQVIKQALRDIGEDDDALGHPPHAMQTVVPVPPEAPPRPSQPAWLGEPDGVHVYRTGSGQTMFVVERYTQRLGSSIPCGEHRWKPSSLWRTNEGILRWVSELPGGELPLYGLDVLAASPHAPVMLTHGEHVADDLRDGASAGKGLANSIVVAVSSLDRDGTRTDLSPLCGRDVYIMPPSGEQGEAFAEQVQERLWADDPSTRVSKVQIIYEQRGVSWSWGLPVSTEGWNLRDFLEHYDNGVETLRLKVPSLRRRSDPVVHDQVIDEFTVNATGVWVQKRVGDDYKQLWLSSPIYILGLARNSDSQEWGVVVTCSDPDGRWHTWCVPKSMLAADPAGVYKTLSSLGATITTYASYRTELARYLLTVDPGNRALSVTKTGWHGLQFVFPDGSVVDGAGESNQRIVLQTQDPMGGNFVKQRGSLRQWQRTVGARSTGNSRLVLAISAVLAGPVLSLLGEENGGFHFRGNSSIGKTTILYVACGVWGPPRLFMRLWRATANGLESVAASHNDMALVLDEMSQVDASEAGQVAYMLANGQGKLRATQTGDAKPNASWRLVFLSSGEIALKDHVESVGGRVMAGQEARMIDIEADAGRGLGIFEALNGSSSGAELSLTLKSDADRCYGVVGRAWLSALSDAAKRISILDDIRAGIGSFAASVPADAEGQVSRVARRFGLIAAVGEAAINEGLLPWPKGHAIEQIRTCFLDWLARRGGTANLESTQGVEAARRFLQLHGESRFTQLGLEGIEPDTGGPRTINRAGFRRINSRDGSVEFWLFPEVFEREICAGMNKKVVAEELLRQGQLIPGSDGKPYKTVRLPGIGPAKMYCMKATILGGDAAKAPSKDH